MANQAFASLDGHVALVTGGASGIGAATARRLATAGADVAVVDVDQTGGSRVVAEIESLGSRATLVHADLTDLAALPSIVDNAESALAEVDVLINCAGTSDRASDGGRPGIFDLTLDMWERIYTLNLKAPFLLMQEVGRRMVGRGAGGHIVNVTSSSAYRSQALPAYSSSKAGLAQLTRVAAAEFAKHGINVNSVAPGITRTEMTAGFDYEAATRTGMHANLLQRVSEPEDVAAVITFLCLPDSRQITAQAIHTSAGAVV